MALLEKESIEEKMPGKIEYGIFQPIFAFNQKHLSHALSKAREPRFLAEIRCMKDVVDQVCNAVNV